MHANCSLMSSCLFQLCYCFGLGFFFLAVGKFDSNLHNENGFEISIVTIIPLSKYVNQRARVLWVAYHMSCAQRSEKSEALASITTILKMINNLSNKTRTQIEIQNINQGHKECVKISVVNLRSGNEIHSCNWQYLYTIYTCNW